MPIYILMSPDFELHWDSPTYLKEQLIDIMMNDDWYGKYRGPYAVMEQSNGFGKSRACQGLIEQGFYVVYCCLCEDADYEYPRRSCLADRFFNHSNLEQFYTCYFNAFIDLLNTTEISSMDFYEKYSERLDGKDSPIVRKLVESKLEDFSNNQNISLYKGSRPLIFIFDEASSLLRVNPNYQNTTTYFDIMRYILPQLRGNIFVLFVNMFTISSNFDEKRDPDPSGRIAYLPLKEMEPIYLLPNWNVYEDEVVIEKIADSVKIENICMYGRPFWGSLVITKIRNREKYSSVAYKALFDLAIHKLTCGKMTESLNSNDILAVLGCRLGVIQPKSISRRQELVANNMAVCVYVKNSEYLFDIVYPSEPILAESAAFVMGVIGYVKIVESLIESLESSSVSIDDKAGLIAKLILLISRDEAGRLTGGNDPFLYLNVVQV
ncbi:unnamed protein product, partial [Brachionus calyciflorus]